MEDGDATVSAKRVRSGEPPPDDRNFASHFSYILRNTTLSGPQKRILSAAPVTRTVEPTPGHAPSESASASSGLSRPEKDDAALTASPTPPGIGDPGAVFCTAMLAKLGEGWYSSSASAPSTTSLQSGRLPPYGNETADTDDETDDPDEDRSDGGWDGEDAWVPPSAVVATNSSRAFIASGCPTPSPARTDASSSFPQAVSAPPPEPTATRAVVASAASRTSDATPAPDEPDLEGDWLEAVAPSKIVLPDDSHWILPLPQERELLPLTQPTHLALPAPTLESSFRHARGARSSSPSLLTSRTPRNTTVPKTTSSALAGDDEHANSGDEQQTPVPRGFEGARVQCLVCGRWMSRRHTARLCMCASIPDPAKRRRASPMPRKAKASSSAALPGPVRPAAKVAPVSPAGIKLLPLQTILDEDDARPARAAAASPSIPNSKEVRGVIKMRRRSEDGRVSKPAVPRAAAASTSPRRSSYSNVPEPWVNLPFTKVLLVRHYKLCGLRVKIDVGHNAVTFEDDLPTDPDELLRYERQVILQYDVDVARVGEDHTVQCKGCSERIQLPPSYIGRTKWYGCTGHKACCPRKIERCAADFATIPFSEPFRIRKIEGGKVECAGCGKSVAAARWTRHLDGRCPVYPIPPLLAQPTKNRKPKAALNPAIAKRLTQLLADTAVREIGEDRLRCDMCGRWVALCKHMNPARKWYGRKGHRKRCAAAHPKWKPRPKKSTRPSSAAISAPINRAKSGSSTSTAARTAQGTSLISRRS
ncbi:hypothetical protein AURDEDRAFT_163793 [Auricularia subglabra TFB-10046 SS5]|nr:hypothetical protein AURDEDRAFT_163793 [Auricularia subglabra TFB-10046 SS5]